MKCVNCGHALTSVRGTHRYTESGLSNVILENVEIRSCPECGEREIVIPKMAKLHQMIAWKLVLTQSTLTAEVIKYLRKWLGLSSADFALHMGVRPETVSRWESKAAGFAMSVTADRLLRLLVANHDPVEKYPVDLFKRQPRVKPAPIKFRAPDWKSDKEKVS
jgi:putative zinc finger/helix-turn-helix YgiT family protein